MAYWSEAEAYRVKGKAYHQPVVHMNNPEKFKELFILACCKGQAFGKP